MGRSRTPPLCLGAFLAAVAVALLASAARAGGDPALTAGVWWLDSAARPRITALFAPGGKLVGSSGCNRYVARYSTTGNAIRIKLSSLTLVLCSPGEMTAEGTYLGALLSARSYALESRKLKLKDRKGHVLASFTLPP